MLSAANTQVHFRLDFIMEVNTDQTAPKDPYFLQYRLPKKISRWASKITHILTLRKTGVYSKICLKRPLNKTKIGF